MKVSAVILTYNEEVRIKDCLASAAWCDEVVVVDGHSTDSTVAVSREYTDKVFLSDRLGPPKPGGFAEQRNFGLEQASGSSSLTRTNDLPRSSPKRSVNAWTRVLRRR